MSDTTLSQAPEASPASAPAPIAPAPPAVPVAPPVPPQVVYRQTRYAPGPGFTRRRPVATRVFVLAPGQKLPTLAQNLEQVDPSTPVHDWQSV